MRTNHLFSRLVSAVFLMLVLSLLSVSAFAAFPFDESADPFSLSIASGTCGKDLTWDLTADGTLTISGSGKMTDWTNKNAPWYAYRDSIVNIVLSDNITYIGNFAFQECSALTDIVIPESVTLVGNSVFINCSALTDIVIPDSVMGLGYEAFRECSALTGIVIPKSVMSIGAYAFFNCSALTKVFYIGSEEDWDEQLNVGVSNSCLIDAARYYGTDYGRIGNLWWVSLPNETLFIGGTGEMPDFEQGETPWYADRRTISTLWIDSGVTSIGEYAFADCTALTDLMLPEGMAAIGVSAFQNCSALTGIILPDRVTDIGDAAFKGCSAMETVSYVGTADDWNLISIGSENEALTSAGREYLSAYGTCGDLHRWTLSRSGTLTITGEGEMPNWQNSARTPWYTYCSDITKVVISDGVTTIGDTAFREFTALTDIIIPDSVTSIGSESFYKCGALTDIVIPDSVTSIGWWAFTGCTDLTSIVIPESVTEICYAAFSGCNALANVFYLGTEDGWNSLAIGTSNAPLHDASRLYCSESGSSGSLWWVLTRNGTLFIAGAGEMPNFQYGSAPWHGNRKEISSLWIDRGVLTIGEQAFAGCAALTGIVIPESVSVIGASAFLSCSAVTSVSYVGIAEQWNRISINKGNDALTSAELTCLAAFGACGETLRWSLSHTGTLTISGEGETTDWMDALRVPWYAYRAALTGVVISDGVTAIGGKAFEGCQALAYFDVAADNQQYSSVDGVLFNKDQSTLILYPCKKTDTAYVVPDTVVEIPGNAFYLCTALREIRLPDGLTSICDGTFAHCEGLRTIVIPKSVTYIGYDVFTRCQKLEKVYFTGTEAEWAAITINDSGTALKRAKIVYEWNGIHQWGEAVYTWTRGYAQCTASHSCTKCGDTESETVAVAVSTTDPTCTEDGGVIFTAAFTKDGFTQQQVTEVIPAPGHDEETMPAKTATCTEDGLTKGVRCAACGEILTQQEIIPAKGHTEEIIPGKEATLTEEGITDGKHCTVCDETTVEQNVIPKLAYIEGTCGENVNWRLTNKGALTISGEGAMVNYQQMQTPWNDYCGMIVKVVVKKGVTSVGDNAFAGCESLAEVEIAETVTVIGDNVFAECEALETVVFRGEEDQWAEIEIGEGNEPFEAIEVSIRNYIVGDVNGDETINVYDAIDLLSIIANGECDPAQFAVCDVNGDGTINVYDAIDLLSIIANQA